MSPHPDRKYLRTDRRSAPQHSQLSWWCRERRWPSRVLWLFLPLSSLLVSQPPTKPQQPRAVCLRSCKGPHAESSPGIPKGRVLKACSGRPVPRQPCLGAAPVNAHSTPSLPSNISLCTDNRSPHRCALTTAPGPPSHIPLCTDRWWVGVEAPSNIARSRKSMVDSV